MSTESDVHKPADGEPTDERADRASAADREPDHVNDEITTVPYDSSSDATVLPRSREDMLERPGDEIGPYRLLTVIGEGGLGTVWLAERRTPFVLRVALKVIKPGLDSRAVIARFQQERQVLAMMTHPGVAKVLDGGMTPAGRPFFVMEFVKGDPLTAFCDTRRLSIRDRLALFRQVCEAVQHAHQKGIIHRDLKPSNILAFETEGGVMGVKVIDFGVAKATTPGLSEQTVFTEFGRAVGTWGYMSPEQADPTASDIDTRGDVYALGVILYELLTGSLPFDPREIAEVEFRRLLHDVDPPTPSARLSTIATTDRETISRIEKARGIALNDLVRDLRRELEWIPLKAMRKEPQHRYQTALDLAADIGNYLDGKPLVAAPESTAYRLKKYVRRNKGFVIGAAAVLTALVTGLGVATWQWAEAETAREVARAEAARADERAKAALESEATALEERDAAEHARAEATDAKETIERNAYVANMQIAGAWRHLGEWNRVRERIESSRGPLRNWEWMWLDAESDRSLAVWGRLEHEILCATFSANGELIVTTSTGARAHVWLAHTGELLAELVGHAGPVQTAALCSPLVFRIGRSLR